MSKDYIIRSDAKAVTVSDESYVDAEDILKDYPYILDSIEKENYTMEESIGDFFKEILFENKVVGFALYNISPIGYLSLVQIYILPEFRGNKLFLNEILTLLKKGRKFFISLPTRSLIEILMHYDLARKISDNIVLSAIEFEIPFFSAESNTGDYVGDGLYLSNIYALDICSTLILKDISAQDKCVIYYNLFVDNDDDLYDCIDKREEIISDEYFYNIKQMFLDNHDEFLNIVFELKEQLPVFEEGFKSIVGYEDNLSNYMQNMVDSNVLSKRRAFEIKNRLTWEYECGMVTDEAILTRLYFLIDDDTYELTGKEIIDSLFSDEINCPYCNARCDFDDMFCQNCGYNLYYEDIMDDVNFVPALDILTDEGPNNESDKFFNLIDDDSGINEKDIDEFIDMFSDEMQGSDKFQKPEDFPGDDEYNNLSISIKPYEDNSPIILHDLTFYDMLKLMGFKRSLKESNDENYDKYIFKILKYVDEYQNMEIPYIANKSLDPTLKDFLIQEGYVTREVTSETWNQFAQFLTVPELKDILRENYLKVSGRKQELIDRIAESGLSFSSFYNNKDFLTSAGRDYLNEYYWVDLFEKYLKRFDFNDFSFYMETHDGDFNEVAQEYLDKHLEIAFKNQDFMYMFDCLTAKSNLYIHFDDFENLSKSYLKIFCLGVNPVYYDTSVGNPLKQPIMESLSDLSRTFSKKRILKLFNEIWDEMNFKDFVVDKKEAEKILKDLLDNPDCNEYNEYLCDLLEDFHT